MEQRRGVANTRGRQIVLFTGAVFFVIAGGWLWWWTAKGAGLDSLERLVRRRFPSVPQITTQELATRLNVEMAQPVLLDVREREEFDVGHLPGARNVEPDTPLSKLESLLPKNTPIVAYCSIGYRSSALAKRMKEAGYTNVQNLEGSIFRWANEDRPLERNGEPAEKIHPYSNYWRRLVKPERRAVLPIHK